MSVDDYDDELLSMAHDLAGRLLPAFDNTATGIPWPRVCQQDRQKLCGVSQKLMKSI